MSSWFCVYMVSVSLTLRESDAVFNGKHYNNGCCFDYVRNMRRIIVLLD